MKWVVVLLVGLAVVVVAADFVDQREAASRAALVTDFDRHVVARNGLATVGSLYDALGEEGARAALAASAARLGQVLYDGGERVCLWGVMPIESAAGRSEATLLLSDLSTAAGWQTYSLWTTSHPDADIDALRFEPDHLVVDWHDADGEPRQTEIAWVPGSPPGAGRLE